MIKLSSTFILNAEDCCCMCYGPAEYYDEHVGNFYCASCKKAKEKQ